MNIGIVGLGLMGGSIASALKERHNVFGYDIKETSMSYALSRGFVTRVFANPPEMFELSDVLYLCLYPRDCVRFLREWQDLIKAGTVVIEISGIKSLLIESTSPFLSSDYDLVFTHPVAGREKSGVEFSDMNIFFGQKYLIVPTASNQEKNLVLVEKLAKEMGFGFVGRLGAEDHDDIIAYTSQLAHVLALALVDSDDGVFATGHYIGDSYRDLTRIAMINDTLWSELMIENKDHLLKKIDALQASLSAYRDLIASGNYSRLAEKMRKAKSIRQSIDEDDKS